MLAFRRQPYLAMRLSEVALLLSVNIYLTTAQLTTEILTQQGLTATGATVMATGATVTFTPGLSTVTLSIGPGTTVTLGGSSGIPSVLASRYVSSTLELRKAISRQSVRHPV